MAGQSHRPSQSQELIGAVPAIEYVPVREWRLLLQAVLAQDPANLLAVLSAAKGANTPHQKLT